MFYVWQTFCSNSKQTMMLCVVRSNVNLIKVNITGVECKYMIYSTLYINIFCGVFENQH